MKHRIKDGLIELVRIINPCFYWVRCSECPKFEDNQRLLEDQKLPISSISTGDRVIVRQFDGLLYRGVVLGPGTTEDWVGSLCKDMPLFYEIFLVDRIECVKVTDLDIFKFENSEVEVDFHAPHIIGLYGGIPVRKFEYEQIVDEESNENFAMEKIIELFKPSSSLEFRASDDKNVLNDYWVFGEVVLNTKKGTKANLLELLSEGRLVNRRADFVRVVNVSDWTDRVKVEAELVEEMINLKEITLKEEVEKCTIPPAPEVIYDAQKMIEFRKLIRTENSLIKPWEDLPVPIIRVESFAEFNRRHSSAQKQTVRRETNCSSGSASVNIPSLLPINRRHLNKNASDSGKGLPIKSSTFESDETCSHESPQWVSDELSLEIPDSPRTLGGRGKLFCRTPKVSSADAHPRLSPGRGKLFQPVERPPDMRSSIGRGKLLEASHDPVYRRSFHLGDTENVSGDNKVRGCESDSASSRSNYSDAMSGHPPLPTQDDGPVKMSRADKFCSLLRVKELDQSAQSSTVSPTKLPTDEELPKRKTHELSPGGDNEVNACKIDPLSNQVDSLDVTLGHPPPPAQDDGPVKMSRSEFFSSLLRGKGINQSVHSTVAPTKLPISEELLERETQAVSPGGDNNEFTACESDSSDVIPGHPQLPPLDESPRKISRADLFGPSTRNTEKDQSIQDTFSSTKLPSIEELPESETQRVIGGAGRGRLALYVEEMLEGNSVDVKKANCKPVAAAFTSSLIDHECRVGNLELVGDASPANQERISKTPQELCENIHHTESISSGSTSEINQPISPPTRISKKGDMTGITVASSDHLESRLSTMLNGMKLKEDRCSNDEFEETGTEPTDDSQVEPSWKSVPMAAASSDVGPNCSVEGSNIWRFVPRDKAAQILECGSGILHGCTDIKPAEYIADLGLDDRIRSVLFTKFRELTRPQRFTMPAILGRRNVVLVGPPMSKKSSAFVVPLMNLLLDEEYYSVLRPGNGPRCVLVTPSSDRVKELRNHCVMFSGGLITPSSIIATYKGGMAMERKEELSSGCEILITTPRCWLQLLEYSVVTNMSRLTHMVLDQFHTLCNLFTPELGEIRRKVKALETLRGNKGKGFEALKVQTIINSEQWTTAVETYATKILDNPVVVITSYVEALLYARIKLVVATVEAKLKCAKVRELVNKHVSKSIVIFCNTSEQVEELLEETVPCSGHNFIAAHGKMEASWLSEVPDQWIHSRKPPVLLRTDDTMGDFCITDADVVIHFNLPESRSTFSERFAVLRDHIPDRILHPEVDRPQCLVHVLFDDKVSEAPFPFFVDLLQRYSGRLSERSELIEIVKAIQMRKEISKTTSFCERILSRGHCYEESACPERHVIKPEVDKPRGDESQGLISVEILGVHSAVKFAARIVAVNPDPKGAEPWQKADRSFLTLKLKMAAYFGCPKNRRLHGRVKPGDVLAHKEDSEDKFHRARVLKITQLDKQKEPTQVKLFHMDVGEEVEAEAYTLFELPKEFQTAPDQAVFVYVGNLEPIDLDIAWSETARKSVEREIKARSMEDLPNQEIIGNVLFTIGHNYVVDDLRWHLKLEHASAFVLDIRKHIIQKQFGLDNPKYTPNMRKLFSQAFGCDQIEREERPCRDIQEHRTPPTWAHLSTGENYISVSVTAVKSLARFFVILEKFIPRRIELQKDIKKALSENKLALSSPYPGDVCVTERPTVAANEKIWHRCQVQKVENGEATVLLVDTGETHAVPVDDLYSIPWKLVTELPFQAIECSLYGLERLVDNQDEDFPKKVVGEFQQMISKYSAKGVCVKMLDLEAAENTGGKRHSVVILGVEEQEVVNFNERLLNAFYVGVPMPAFDVNVSEVLEHQGCNAASTAVATDDSDEELDTPGDPVLPVAVSSDSGVKPPLEFNWDEVDQEELDDFIKDFLNDNGSPPPTNGTQPLAEEPAPQGSDASNVPRDEASEQREPARPPSPEPRASLVPEVHPPPLLVPAFEFKNPEVAWRQDPFRIGLRFKIPCLEAYKIHVKASGVCFIGHVEGMKDVYAKHIFFFGPVRLLSENLDGLGLTVKLVKIVAGYDWPRLTFIPTRDRLVKMDAVSSEGDDDDLPLLQQYIEKGKRELYRRGPRRPTSRSTQEHVMSDDEYEDELCRPYRKMQVGLQDYVDFLD